jgi:uracil-DNA glycosylase family 4
MPAVPAIGAECDDDGGFHLPSRRLDDAAMHVNPDPPRDCPRCPRLVAFREAWRDREPGWWNSPVGGWGDPDAWLMVVGLAPGLRGANRTGRPFTGDHAGALLFDTVAKFGLSNGAYDGRPDDGLVLDGLFVDNSAACVPPENKPLPAEIHNCRPFLEARIASMPRLRVLIALGTIAHQSTVRALGEAPSRYRFGHGVRHDMPNGLTLFDSYHCSRYNTNTGKLTPAMFEAVFAAACELRP